MNSLEQIAGQLRMAMKSGNFTEAQRHLACYASALDQAVTAVAAAQQDGQAGETLRRALEFLNWAGRTVRSQRAHIALELARLGTGLPYWTPDAEAQSTFQLRG